MFTFGNDFASRDPVEWILELTSPDGSTYKYTHFAQKDKEPERFGQEKF